MSIIHVPALLHCQTVHDWMTTLQKYSSFTAKHQINTLESSRQNAIIYFAIQGITPFFTCCVLFKKEIYLLAGEEYLMKLYRFIMQNEPIYHKSWPFPHPFPFQTENGTFSDMSKSQQQQILSAKIRNNDYRAETYNEFEALCQFYQKTDSLISSPI